ncbi:MAG: type II toxin-antitoxin system RelB/DinJ family antitoxin [Nitrospinales bacterium]
MPNETIQIRVSRELKEESEAVFKSIGLKTSEAIRLFLQQSINNGGLPFQPMAAKSTKSNDPMDALKDLQNENLEDLGELNRNWYAD